MFSAMIVAVALGAEPVSNYEHLKALDEAIGAWAVERVDPQTKEATPTGIRVVFKWILNKNAVSIENYTSKGVLFNSEIVFWDASTQGIKSWGCNIEGGHYQLVRSDEDGEVYFKGRYCDADGAKGSLEVMITSVDETRGVAIMSNCPFAHLQPPCNISY